MSNQLPDNPNKRGSSLPPRTVSEYATRTPEEVINAAPLATQSTEVPKEVEVSKPWRIGTSMSEDELMVITKKDSFNIPMELSMRLDYILSQKKAKALGRKNNRTTLLIEALDEYTKRELKKLGHSV